MEEAVFGAAEAFFDGFVGNLERRGGDAAVVVAEAEAVVAPDKGGTAGAAAGWDARFAFPGFRGLAGFGGEPVLSMRGGGESADCLGGW